MTTIFHSIAAFLYLMALWYSAPLFCRNSSSIPDRLRTGIILGIALPALLGALGVLYAPLLWLILSALVAYRSHQPIQQSNLDTGLLITLGATVLLCWPPLMRPLLDGDTLLYHLPNAVAFVQDHSIWTARAPYWFYPQASELFAGGLFAVSGIWSLPIAGILPALLITARIYSVGRATQAPACASSGVALAFIFMPVCAFEAGTLQNDLWLAAFFAEVVAGADRSPSSVAVCAFLKPFGWLEAVVASLSRRLPWRTVAIALVPLAVWVVHDFVLILHGSKLGVYTPPYFASTIAGNIAVALPELVHGVAIVTPQSFPFLGILAFGFLGGTRRYTLAGLLALVIYAFLPLAFSSGPTNYVLNASSFRFALPALACGALVAVTLARRAPVWYGIIGYALAGWGAWNFLSVYWNDAYTHWSMAAALLAVGATAITRRTRGISVALFVLSIILAGRWGASSRSGGFYGDWMRTPSGKPTGIFSWITRHRPHTIIAENVRIGAILAVSPQTHAYAAIPPQGCAEARGKRALLLVGSNEGLSGEAMVQALADARSCGTVLYSDPAGVIVAPHPW